MIATCPTPGTADAPPPARHPASQTEDGGMNLRERLERVERNMLLDCLRKNRGNQSQAARELGLPRRTLLYRMDRLKISTADV